MSSPALTPENLALWRALYGYEPGPRALDHMSATTVNELLDAARAQGREWRVPEGWTREMLGQAIYMSLYGHQGAAWAASDSKEVWYACADKVLAASPSPSTTED